MDADDTINLLDETLAFLVENGKSGKDVIWVGNEDGTLAISWLEFTTCANQIYNNSSHVGVLVAMDLVVVGKDWWLERHDYEGAEWWEFKTLPQRTENALS